VNGAVPRRVTVVFAGLVVATCITWWLGSGSSPTGNGVSLAATLTVLIASAKVYFIGRDFMELRSAPSVLRAAFNVWVGVVAVAAIALVVAPTSAHADNKRLNDGVAQNVYTIQHQAGCTTNLVLNPQLQLAAQWQADDVLTNRSLDGDLGSDGSTPQDRANAAGFHGKVAETVAINPALAMSGIELINQWYYNPDYLAIMQDCANTLIGVWSANSLDRTVVVAVYGQPA
jgi:hypothetical protein